MNILNLDSWAVIETAQNDHDYRIVARYEIESELCHHCYTRNISRFGKIEQLYMDLPLAPPSDAELSAIEYLSREDDWL